MLPQIITPLFIQSKLLFSVQRKNINYLNFPDFLHWVKHKFFRDSHFTSRCLVRVVVCVFALVGFFCLSFFRSVSSFCFVFVCYFSCFFGFVEGREFVCTGTHACMHANGVGTRANARRLYSLCIMHVYSIFSIGTHVGRLHLIQCRWVHTGLGF